MNYETTTTLSTNKAMQVLNWCKLFTNTQDLEYIELAFHELDKRYIPYSEEWTQAKLYMQQAINELESELKICKHSKYILTANL